MNTIFERIEAVRNEIAGACMKSGRKVDEVKLIAVSKTRSAEEIIEAYRCGIRDFGENRVQELMKKQAEIDLPINWHLIGRLQTNKVKYLPGAVSLVHSIDSERLALETEKQAQKHGIILEALCEINIAGEASKGGLNIDTASDEILSIVKNCPNIRIKGLMTVAPRTDVPESNRVYFKRLKELMYEINARLPSDKVLSELSMGMSNDYVTAIEEGATFVRVGTAIFGARDYGENKQ